MAIENMADPAKTFAFIGLGVMGYPMAVNLRKGLSSEYTLLICDVNKDAIAKFQKQMEGQGPIEVVENGMEAVKRANMVITMLPNSSAVKTVYLDPQTGLIPTALTLSNPTFPRHKILMECGTIETATILAVADAVNSSPTSPVSATRKHEHDDWVRRSAELTFVDAPVSGGPMGAEDGTLTFMVGAAEKESFEKVKGALKYMGKEDSVFHCGDVGSGTAFKIINNYLSAITSLAASEALNIGAKMGLDLKLLTDVINVSGGQCWVTSKSNPVPGVQANVPSSRGYEGGFRIELCEKVLKMGSELARDVGARTVLDGPALEAFKEAREDERYKGKDARVVYKWLNESERK
ncbi:related to 3-hydroxyisobutyrate dehydrogenase [Phialocephala subalpina]|uniref:3-hydroxyisobutyrate dehydrogenase n=1 Tax=Phialocephala subalpina TaxID=576137 RepID=A0A1L7WN74_9HELO|nr:related to 3-hydroxyisobutyrate dehydrogenase [Phialocephala subalpina]